MRITVRAVFLGVVVALASLAGASAAGATTFAPAGDAFSAKSSKVTFITNNGTGVTVTCTSSAFTATVPASPNNALGGGAVVTKLTTQPSFTGCTSISGFTTTVTTNHSAGLWTMDAMDFPNATSTTSDAAAGDAAALGIPKASIVTTVSSGSTVECKATAPPTESSALLGAWKDGTTQAPASTLAIKGQIDASFTGTNCLGAAAPVVLTGSYSVKDTTHPTSPITF